MTNKEKAKKILALQIFHEKERNSLIEFAKYMWKQEKKQEFDVPKHYYDIEEKLMKMLNGEITRLIINVPPRTGKTLLITELFPVWAMGKKLAKDFIATGYSTSLTREFSGHSRDWFNSPSFKRIFPECLDMREDQNTKEYWKTEDECSYYATGAGGSITGRGCDIFIIDDPIKPDEADVSEVARDGINNWYLNTVVSRLNNPRTGGIIIIMQRTHDNDLAGFLMERESKGIGSWDKIVVPAIDIDGKSISEDRFPIDILKQMRSDNPVVFSCQYQQEPTNKDAQEFHQEHIQFHDDLPTSTYKRWFAMLDPAFREGKEHDRSALEVFCVVDGIVHLEEIIAGRFTTYETEDKCLYVARKYDLEKFFIEDYGAQVTMENNVKRRFEQEGIYTPVEGFNQKGKKTEKIRSIISPIRNRKISFKRGIPMLEELFNELWRFPRGSHDDLIDCLQMGFNACDLQPHTSLDDYEIEHIEYNDFGQPIFK